LRFSIEGGIRQRLSGLTYRGPAQGLLPDTRIASWAIDTAHANASEVARSGR